MKAREFTLPSQYDNEDIERYGNRAAEIIMAQMSEMIADNEDEVAVCNKLVAFTEQLDSDVALSILYDINFQLRLGPEAKQIIVKAKTNEQFIRSPFMRDPTFACIFSHAKDKRYEKVVEEFLCNPKWFLCWLEKAPALEAFLTITEFFTPHRSHYWAELQARRDEEVKSFTYNPTEVPGFATIFAAIINHKPLGDTAYTQLLPALNNPQFVSANLRRVMASAQARILLSKEFMPDDEDRKACTMEVIRAADECLINCPELSLTKADFSKLHLNGALFNGSALIECVFNECVCYEGQFNDCVLNGTDFSNATFVNASFFDSILRGVQFIGTILAGTKFVRCDLTGVDFSLADLTDVDFTGCNLEETKDIIFISRATFRSSRPQESLESTFNTLAKMLEKHSFKAELRGAILNDLIEYCTKILRPNEPLKPNEEILSPRNAIDILCMAYETELFAGHRNFRKAKDFYNAVTSGASTIWSYASHFVGLSASGNQSEVAEKQAETSAQIRIREAIKSLHKFKTDRPEAQAQIVKHRPAPPQHRPPAPGNK